MIQTLAARPLARAHIYLRMLCIFGLIAVGFVIAKPGAAGASAAPFVVGSVGTYTGQDSGDYAGAHDALEAWAKWTNAHGGIHGHPVHLIIMDDQSNATIELQDVEKLVQQDHVMAVIADNSNEDADIGGYLQQNHVALIGATSIPPPASDSLFFPVGSGELAETYGDLVAAKIVKAKKLGVIYCAEVAVCAQFVPVIKTYASSNSESVVYVSAADENQTSYATYCLAAKQHGATGLYIALTSASTIGVAQSCSEQGYKTTYLVGGANVGPDITKLSSFNGSVASEGVFPWISSSNNAEKTFHQALNKYFPGLRSSNNYNAAVANAWADAEMFTAAAEHASKGTAAALISGLYSLKNETLGGLIAPVTFKRGVQANPTCFFIMKDVKGTEVPLNGGKYLCEPKSSSAS